MRRLLVTGAQGFLGRHVVAAALADPDVSVVIGTGRSAEQPDHYTHSVTGRGGLVAAPLPGPIHAALHDDRYAYQRCDLTSRRTVRELLHQARPDVVVHAAASLRGSGIDDLLQANLLATAGLVSEIAAARGPRPVTVVVSSGSVYGAAAALPITEALPCRPTNAYGHTKLAAEHAALAVAAEAGVDLRIARVFNLVGPGLQERHLPATVAAQVAAAQAADAPAPLLLGNVNATRDFMDVRDAAVGVLLIAQRGETGMVVNVASGIETPIEDVVTHLVSRSRVAITRGRRDEAEQRGIQRAVADTSRLRALGRSTVRPLADSLDGMLTYYLDDVAQSGSSDVNTASAT